MTAAASSRRAPCMRANPRSFLLAALVLAGCGGGGGSGGSDAPDAGTIGSSGGDLTVDFEYDTWWGYLWRSSHFTPALSGLEGHAPHCELTAGALPQGMTLDAASCAVKGTPQDLGQFPVSIQLTVPGYHGSITHSPVFRVLGPPVTYYPTFSVAEPDHYVTEEASFAPNNVNSSIFPNWKAGSGETVAYSVVEGSLPAGLSIDAATGTISGVFASVGSWSFRIQATAQRSGASATGASDWYYLHAKIPVTLSYTPASAKVGQAYSVQPTVSSNLQPWSGATYQYSPTAEGNDVGVLPDGLSIAADTGIISGTPTAATQPGLYYGVAAIVTRNGASFSVRTSLQINVQP